MKRIIQKIPVPICGLMLACFAFGSLEREIPVLHIAFGCLGGLLFLLVMAISAIASGRMTAYATGAGICTGLGSWVSSLASAEAVIAGCLVVCVLVRYAVFLISRAD